MVGPMGLKSHTYIKDCYNVFQCQVRRSKFKVIEVNDVEIPVFHLKLEKVVQGHAGQGFEGHGHKGQGQCKR